jgi:2-oxo-4-hydroxy-4-carboxy-5-ureidoimidazoline decarboxylase
MKLSEANIAGAAAFADIAEHSPWVAEHAFLIAPFPDRNSMIKSFTGAVMTAERQQQLDLLRAHPDLATKAKLTTDSNKEQMGAGLDTLNAEEFAQFTQLNTAYKAENNFPFIFAVKGANKHEILAAFERRIKNDSTTEFRTALEQVCRIIRFRLEDRVQK